LTPRFEKKPFLDGNSVAFALRCLEGVDLPVLLGPGRALDVGGHVADPRTPLHGGIGEADAVLAGGKLLNPLAALALLNNGVTVTAIELTPAFAHEKALQTFLDCCTNHGYHVLSFKIGIGIAIGIGIEAYGDPERYVADSDFDHDFDPEELSAGGGLKSGFEKHPFPDGTKCMTLTPSLK
jgi:hypothetical protein